MDIWSGIRGNYLIRLKLDNLRYNRYSSISASNSGYMDGKKKKPCSSVITITKEDKLATHMTLDDMVAEGDKVAVRFTLTGTYKGEYRGV